MRMRVYVYACIYVYVCICCVLYMCVKEMNDEGSGLSIAIAADNHTVPSANCTQEVCYVY